MARRAVALSPCGRSGAEGLRDHALNGGLSAFVGLPQPSDIHLDTSFNDGGAGLNQMLSGQDEEQKSPALKGAEFSDEFKRSRMSAAVTCSAFAGVSIFGKFEQLKLSGEIVLMIDDRKLVFGLGILGAVFLVMMVLRLREESHVYSSGLAEDYKKLFDDLKGDRDEIGDQLVRARRATKSLEAEAPALKASLAEIDALSKKVRDALAQLELTPSTMPTYKRLRDSLIDLQGAASGLSNHQFIRGPSRLTAQLGAYDGIEDAIKKFGTTLDRGLEAIRQPLRARRLRIGLDGRWAFIAILLIWLAGALSLYVRACL